MVGLNNEAKVSLQTDDAVSIGIVSSHPSVCAGDATDGSVPVVLSSWRQVAMLRATSRIARRSQLRAAVLTQLLLLLLDVHQCTVDLIDQVRLPVFVHLCEGR